MTNDDTLARIAELYGNIKEFTRKHQLGGCRVLSAALGKIEKCECVFCQLDELATIAESQAKRLAVLELMSHIIDRLPFCPDHRDKVAGKPCRECEIERLTKRLAEIEEGHFKLHKHKNEHIQKLEDHLAEAKRVIEPLVKERESLFSTTLYDEHNVFNVTVHKSELEAAAAWMEGKGDG